MSDNRPVRYIETDADGRETVVYRASGVWGACDRAILAVASGMEGAPFPEWFQEVLDEGTVCEGDIAEKHEANTGIPTVNDQLEVELEIGEIDGRRVIVRGHIDGMADDPLDSHARILREYKKFRPSTWENFLRQGVEVNRNYPGQVSIYMHALGADECEFVGGKVAGYRDENGVRHDTPVDEFNRYRTPVIGEVECKRITAPPIPLKDIKKRIIRFERLVNSGMTPMEAKCPDPFNYPCPFFSLHEEGMQEGAKGDGDAGAGDAKDVTYELPVNDNTKQLVSMFVAACQRQAKAEAEARDAKKKRAAYADELKQIVEAGGDDAKAANRLVLGDVTIERTRKHVPETTRKAYDVDSLGLPRKGRGRKDRS